MDDIVNLVKRITEHTSNSIRVCMPARIESYDYKLQKASIKIDIKELYSDGTAVDYPIVSGVPVMFMSSGGASITMPVNRGDPCLAIFADRDITNWLLGSAGQKPDSARMHTLTDAIAIMGLNSFKAPSQAENNTDLLISYSGSKVRLKPDGIVEVETATEINTKTQNIIVNCLNSTIKATENVNVECKSASINATEAIVSNSKNTNINASENIGIASKNATITTTEALTINCKNAVVTASQDIKTTSVNFLHTGNFKITGNAEITGTAKITQKLTTENGIANSGGNLVSNGKTFETHTHSYNEAVDGSQPTVIIPGTTGAPS